MLRLVKILLLIITTIISMMIFIKSLNYYNPNFQRGYLSDKAIIFDGIFKYGLYAHINFTPLILIVGLTLRLFRIERKNKTIHRVLGKIYVIGVILFAAPGDFIIALYSTSGRPSIIILIIMSILWEVLTVLAFLFARDRKISKHNKYMTRSIILAKSAINLTILSFIFTITGVGLEKKCILQV